MQHKIQMWIIGLATAKRFHLQKCFCSTFWQLFYLSKMWLDSSSCLIVTYKNADFTYCSYWVYILTGVDTQLCDCYSFMASTCCCIGQRVRILYITLWDSRQDGWVEVHSSMVSLRLILCWEAVQQALLRSLCSLGPPGPDGDRGGAVLVRVTQQAQQAAAHVPYWQLREASYYYFPYWTRSRFDASSLV